ncbi:hypothetical protein D3C73_1492660 [compost metagenome]
MHHKCDLDNEQIQIRLAADEAMFVKKSLHQRFCLDQSDDRNVRNTGSLSSAY